jgi:hypothetical protein
VSEAVTGHLLPKLLESLEALLDLTQAALLEAYPVLTDVYAHAREQTAASGMATALFNHAWAIEDTALALRRHLEEIETLERGEESASDAHIPF